MGVREELREHADPGKAKVLQGFFKTGKGQYGEGDVFLGVTVPTQRMIAKSNFSITLKEVDSLLDSKVHEERLTALLILVLKYSRSTDKKKIVDFYLSHTRFINNWDLVDLSADKILGDYLADKDKSILLKLAKSDDLWEKRIAMLSTFAFIRKGDSEYTFKIAELLLHDRHDLIHKAVGWMLREVGKRVSLDAERAFLDMNFKGMPRVMLRYAIERMDEKERIGYLDR